MPAARLRLLALATPLAASVLAGSALAYVCHPDAAGTRTLTLSAPVRSVAVHGSRIDFAVAARNGCRVVSWSTLTGASHARAARCASATRRVASRGPLGTDSRGRPVLLAAGRELPLPAYARSATIRGGLALVRTTRPDAGVFALRLRDGAFTFLGPDGGAFAPRLVPGGALFHDGEMKAPLRAGKTVVKLVPRRALARGFARTTAPLRTGGAVHGLAMDGLRVALSVADRTSACDRVLYWNVAWSPVQRISAPDGPTCDAHGTRIGAVAIGGFRTEWLASSSRGTRLIAGSPLCQEWVVRRLAAERLAAVAADGSLLAYATTSREQGARGLTSVGVVTGSWRARQVATGAGTPLLAAAGHRVAVLWPDGTAELRTPTGARLARFHVGIARAIALEGTTLAALRGSRLELFDTRTGTLTRSLPVAAGATGLDLQDGVAAFARGAEAVVLDTHTGRSAVVGRGAHRLVGVQIEGPGLAYAWSTARGGVARFVPTIRIEAALG